MTGDLTALKLKPQLTEAIMWLRPTGATGFQIPLMTRGDGLSDDTFAAGATILSHYEWNVRYAARVFSNVSMSRCGS